MGKATRWLKSFFGIKNSKDYSNSGDRKDRKRCSIGHSRRDSRGGLCRYTTTIPPSTSPAGAWLRSYSDETEKEQNMHAIAVAAATAAAADAAVAAAKAAMAVVRLTSQGRGGMFDEHERRAAVKIQTVFRGYLSKQSRRALRALKGLVKLQALVRGHLVRKHAAMMLNHEANRARKSMERLYTFDTANGIDESSIGRPKSRSRRNNTRESDFQDEQPLHRTWSFSTAQNTPRVMSCRGSNSNAAPKSVGADKWFRHYWNMPNLMGRGSTQSLKGKWRSQSAPKQRAEAGPKKRLSLDEMGFGSREEMV
ncbi:hypothetical protein GQ457_18G012410 [Hibiscus cannabinus]